MKNFILVLALMIPTLGHADEATSDKKTEERTISSENPNQIPESAVIAIIPKRADSCTGGDRVKRSCHDNHPVLGY